MKRLKKASAVILIIVLLWVAAFSVDYISAAAGNKPVFCVRTDETNYIGLGYSYLMYPHIITGKQEFALYFLGLEVKSTFTNQKATAPSE